MRIVNHTADGDAIITELRKISVNESGAAVTFSVGAAQSPGSFPIVSLGGSLSEYLTLISHGTAIIILSPIPPTEKLEALIANKLVNPHRIILMGTRRWSMADISFIKTRDIKCYPMKEITNEGLPECTDSIMSAAKDATHCIVLLDMNILDPAFIPTSTVAEPGGLTSRELIYIIQRLRKLRNFTAAIITTLNNPTLCAKIIAELASQKP